jgi:hypothetical protein
MRVNSISQAIKAAKNEAKNRQISNLWKIISHSRLDEISNQLRIGTFRLGRGTRQAGYWVKIASRTH